MQTLGHGELLNRRFGLQNPATLMAAVPTGNPITFTHLSVDAAGQALGAVPPEDAYSIHIHQRPITRFDILEPGRVCRKEFAEAGTLCFFDLRSPPQVRFETPFHTIRSYVPFRALQDFLQESGVRRQVLLRPPSCGAEDPIVRHLFACLEPTFRDPQRANSLFVDHVALALQAHLLQKYATVDVALPSVRRGLAVWQERRVKELIDANLDGDISIARLASECGLSSSHFARAFRQATGRPPHRWLLERRVETAQGLLVNSNMSLPEIAKMCGFSDQSHLTRAFTRMVGISPGAWRRARRR